MPVEQTDAATRAVMDCQQHFWQALQAKDAQILSHVLADDFICYSPNHPPQSRAAFVATIIEMPVNVIRIEVIWRRGAARIFAHNITEVDQEYCIANMTTLLNDTDNQVRAHISALFHQLRSNYLMTLRPFLENYANSLSFYTQTHFFGNYLWANGAIYPDIVLLLINIAALNTRIPEDNPGYFDGDEFVRVVLRVYTDPVADDSLRHRAMDVFDLLMERYPNQALRALDEWDQR